MILAAATLLGLALRGAACGDDHFHAHDGHAQEYMGRPEYPSHVHEYVEKPLYPQVPLSPPSRPLEWKDFNVIHTTDTHGWLLGHQKLSFAEPYYSGDLGDFSSFVTHMKEIAIAKDVDLLLIDTGDLHDGTGFSDGLNTHESNEFIKRLPYDLMTIGNHDLKPYATAYDIHTNLVPRLNGRYLTSNVDITVIDSDGNLETVPVGNRSITFTTRKGRRITSLGIIYDLKDSEHSKNTKVQPVKSMTEETWFKEAIDQEPDAFVLIGHMAASDDDWNVVINKVREKHAQTPILIFGGHSHIRDCKTYANPPDGSVRSVALQSGRYMETIGWMSVDLKAAKGNNKPLDFSRRYLDQNRVTYQYHTQSSGATFDTLEGRSISFGLQELAARLNLFNPYGTVPHDYTLNQSTFGTPGSLHTFYIEEAVPHVLAIKNPRKLPNIIISNTNALRFDLFKGSFTKNDELSIMVYADEFLYIPDVPFGVASKVLDALNGPQTLKGKRDVDHAGVNKREATSDDLPFGYVTKDSCPDPGNADDTKHAELPNYPFPHYISSKPPSGLSSDESIDLVFLDYLGSRVIKVLNDLQKAKTYTSGDVAKSPYSVTRTNEVLGLYARDRWN